jgi:potassium efflux system protein
MASVSNSSVRRVGLLALLVLCPQPLEASARPRAAEDGNAGEAGQRELEPARLVSQEEDEQGGPAQRVWTTGKLKKWLDAATSSREALPADSAAASHAGRMRKALDLRIELFKELLLVRESMGGIGAVLQELSRESARLEAELDTLRKAGEPKVLAQVNGLELAAQERRLTEARQELTSAEQAARERQQQLEAIPKRRRAAGERRERSSQALEELPRKTLAAGDRQEKEHLDLLLKNARLEHRLAQEQLLWLEREQELLEEGKELDAQRILRLQLVLARVELEINLYRQTYGTQLDGRQREVLEQVARKQVELAQAEGPAEKFLAGWQVRLWEEQARLLELEQDWKRWHGIAEAWEQRLQAEKKEFEDLKQLIAQSSTGRSAGLRLKMSFGRLQERRAALATLAVPRPEERMDELQGWQMEVQEQLRGLDEGFNERFEAVVVTLPEDGRGALRATATAVREQVRKRLLEHRSLLAKATDLGVRLEVLSQERTELLDASEALILSRVFWIRDAPALGSSGPQGALGELERQSGWLGGLFDDLLAGRLTGDRSTLMLILWVALLLFLLPALLIAVQLRLGRAVRARSEGPTGEPSCLEQAWQAKTWTFALAMLSAVPLALYGLLLGLWISTAGLGSDLDRVLSRVLVWSSVLLFFWLATRALLGRRCLAASLLDMPPEATASLSRFIRWLLLAYLILMVPAGIWEGAPFGFVELPRIAYTLFYLLALVALWPLLRRRSPLVGALLGYTVGSRLWRAWGIVAVLVMLLFVAILVMDVLGYRFGAARLARSAAWSIGSLLALAAAYRLALRVLARRSRDHAREATTAPGEEADELDAKRSERLRRFLRTAFLVLGLGLLALFWDVGLGALHKLTVVSFTGASGEPESMSVGDLLYGLVILVITIWIVRNLRALVDVFVFPHLTMAQGTRYAILTISRWTLFVAGVLLTLSAFHLDLGRIGWLVAAMGVGIGFGLQEIIANMVSGVILLIERPIRVGDLLTVGEISGEVRRINIRATTILNFDRQEVIVPNKDFITREVTNWTLADRVLRLAIPIGVAYGTDVDQVRELLLQIAGEQPEVLASPAPQAYFMGHGESSLDFKLFLFLARPEDRLKITDRVNGLINRRLAERGIEIPFPQRDLHIRSGELPARPDGPKAGGRGG